MKSKEVVRAWAILSPGKRIVTRVYKTPLLCEPLPIFSTLKSARLFKAASSESCKGARIRRVTIRVETE